MAASGSPLEDLCQEATCPICLDYFKDPVTITDCGHNFCHACLTHCWGESAAEASCPLCRKTGQQRTLIPNRQLMSFVELTKKLRLRGRERVCEKHQEPLKLFCKEDQSPICLVCDRSKEHKNHEVIPAEEAAQEFKERIRDLLVLLRKSEKCILENEAKTEKESQDLLMRTKTEKEKTLKEFRQLHQFLEEQEKILVTQIEEVEKEIVSKREEHLARLSQELSSLKNLIGKMAEKCQQPPSELLQDIQDALQRCEGQLKFDNGWQSPFSPAVKWKTWEFCDISSFVEGIMKQMKDMLVYGRQLHKANVTLDPDTAHPQFNLSGDHKSVRRGLPITDEPPNPKRFDCYPFVLGCQEFTTGRYFWEVTVERSDTWAVGIARKSVRRKGIFECSPREGFWAVGKCEGEHTDFDFTYVPGEVRTVRVSLNCPGGRVAFYNAETADLLSVISGASFSGETVLPFFYLRPKRSFINLFSPFSRRSCLTLTP